jgi:hypothetical protein
VLHHLERRDWAAAEEVRLAKPQATWSREEHAAFLARLKARPRATQDRPATALFVEAGRREASHAALIEIAQFALGTLADMRRTDPRRELPIVPHILTTDGRLLVTHCGSDDRIAVLRLAAQQLPIFGCVLAFDAFAHRFDGDGVSTKVDTLLAHVIARDFRHVLQRPYRIAANGAPVFEAEQDVDMHDPATGEFEDPYAFLFVSVPTANARPS